MMKRFRLQDRFGHDVLGDEVGENNAYISFLGKVIKGAPPSQLDVGDACIKEYALSGSRKTRYWVVRVA